MPAEIAAREAACPSSDSVPYSADCLAFLEGVGAPPAGWLMRPARSAPAAFSDGRKRIEPDQVAVSGRVCPDNDNQPYGDSCITFLTGWFWRPM
jgi:hypothetical protein